MSFEILFCISVRCMGPILLTARAQGAPNVMLTSYCAERIWDFSMFGTHFTVRHMVTSWRSWFTISYLDSVYVSFLRFIDKQDLHFCFLKSSCYLVCNHLLTTHLVKTCFNIHESVLFIFTHCTVTHYTHRIIKKAETYFHLDVAKSTMITGLTSILNDQSIGKDLWVEG